MTPTPKDPYDAFFGVMRKIDALDHQKKRLQEEADRITKLELELLEACGWKDAGNSSGPTKDTHPSMSILDGALSRDDAVERSIQSYKCLTGAIVPKPCPPAEPADDELGQVDGAKDFPF